MKVLFLAHLFPLPLDSGGKIKSYHTLRALADEHELHVVAFVRTAQERELIDELAPLCAGLDVVELERSKMRGLLDAAASLAARRSFIVGRDYRADMAQVVKTAMDRFAPDVVHIDHLQMAQFVDFQAAPATVLDHHNVESMIIRRIAKSSKSIPMRMYAGIEWPKLQAYELDICRRCDVVVTVSEEDKSTLQSMDSSLSNVYSVPIGVDVNYFQPVQRDRGSLNILSVGTMHWPPNVESMHYFYREVFPTVRQIVPGCTLTIAGQRPVQSILDLQSDPSVTVTGYVDDVRDISKNCGVFIVPLKSGSGVRVKILNALAMGLPVVSTSLGAEGLDVESGKHLLIADSPDDFARKVAEVLENPELGDMLGENGRARVCERYSWDIVGRQWRELYDRCLAPGRQT